MKRTFKILLLSLLGFFHFLPGFGQLRYVKEFAKFKEQDFLQPPPEGVTLFVGSSSIRKWKSMQSAFPEQRVLNRGFGGSTLVELKEYLDYVVLPYKPGQIIIYSGENDIVTGISAAEVLNRFDAAFGAIRKEMPDVHIVFISIKPSPSRERFMPLTVEANALIRKYLEDKPNTAFVDVYSPMLGEDGKPLPDIFEKDMLHMNERGYQIWAEALRPYLK